MKNMNLIQIIAILSIPAMTHAQSLCFDPAADNRYSCNQWPREVVSADFNEDGHLDIITANNGDGSDFLAGNGDGTFDVAVAVVDLGGDEIETADFNNDGHADIVRYSWNSGYITINLGNGDGTFDGGIQILSGSSGNSNAELTIGHYDNNGFIDIGVNDPDDDQIHIIANFNGSSYIYATSIDTGDNPVNVSSGDLNGDGYDDMVVAYYPSNTVDFIYNVAGLSYNLVSYTIGIAVGNDLAEIEIADFDQINGVDVWVNSQTTAEIFMNNGDDTFDQTNAFTGSYAYGSVTGDYNGDGYLDVALANNSGGGISVIMNESGVFSGTVSYYNAGEQTFELCTGDFNEDGKFDIVTANDNAGNISYLIGHGDGSFGPLSLLTGQGGNGIASGDFDEDGDLDVVGMNTYISSFSVSLNNGEGSFSQTVFYPIAGQGHHAAVADFDGDNHLDLVTHSSEGFLIFNGIGDGTFEYNQTIPTSSVGSGGNRTITVNDFNGDGHPDIAGTFVTDDQLSVVYGDGNGVFSAALNITAGDYPRYITSGDLNNDGAADIAITSNFSNELYVFLSTGNSFSSPQTLATGNSPEGVTIFDANGDNYAEVAVVSPNSNTLGIYPNSLGAITTAVNYSVTANANPNGMTHGDVNNDGIEDIVIAFYQTGEAAVLFGNGNATFQPAITFDVDQWPGLVITGNFNEDDALDLAVLNTGTNNISVILNNSAFIEASGPTTFCEGESVTLSVGEGYSYAWNNGETTQSIVVDTDGSFYCIISNQAGDCDLLTPEIAVIVEQSVPVAWNTDIGTFCLNSDTEVLGGGQPTGGEYTGPGVVNGVFDPADAGIGEHVITYAYTSAGSCFSGEATQTLEVVDALNVTFELPVDTVCLNQYLVLSGGSPAGGVYLIEDLALLEIFTTDFGTGPWDIHYEVTISENCAADAEDILYIDSCIGVEEQADIESHILPNVTSEQFMIKGTQPDVLEIFDSNGRLVFRESPVHRNVFSVKEYSSGLYVVKQTSENKVLADKLIVR